MSFSPNTVNNILEIIYIVIGLISFTGAYLAFSDKNHPNKIGTSLFWSILAFIFIFGPYVDKFVIGCLIIIMGALTAFKQVKVASFLEVDYKVIINRSNKLGDKIYLPIAIMGISAIICTFIIKTNGSLIGMGLGGVIGIILSMLITKSKVNSVSSEGGRLIQQIGPSAILPQLLAALGVVFTKAEVGQVIANGLAYILPKNNLFLGVVIYCISMAIFSIIMGNAFAAFTVITTGIGIPFVLSFGANPAYVGAIAMAAGFCGTLLSPMAANFNVVPALILETKNKNRVIIEQAKIAISLLIILIFLMYLLGFLK